MGVSGLTVIARYPDPIALELFRGRLAAEGIESFLHGEHAAAILPIYNWSLQGRGTAVAVREEDAERAFALYEELEGPQSPQLAESLFKCPECGSEDIEQPSNWKSLPAVISVFFIYILGWLIRPKGHCNSCSHRW